MDLENDLQQVSNISSANVNFCLIQIKPDGLMNKDIRSLNNMQLQVFDVINKWLRDYVKSRSAKFPS